MKQFSLFSLSHTRISGATQGEPDGNRSQSNPGRSLLKGELIHGAIRITADTLRHWIYRYRKGGIIALEDRPRKNKGGSLVPKALTEHLVALRNEFPNTSTEALLMQMLNEGRWNGVRPSRSALYRLARNKSLERKPLDAAAIQEAHAFAYDVFGQLWVADFLHGPKVRVGSHMKKTYLLCILDDATHFDVFAALGWSEDTAVLIDGLSLAIRRFGVPEKFYTMDRRFVPNISPWWRRGWA